MRITPGDELVRLSLFPLLSNRIEGKGGKVEHQYRYVRIITLICRSGKDDTMNFCKSALDGGAEQRHGLFQRQENTVDIGPRRLNTTYHHQEICNLKPLCSPVKRTSFLSVVKQMIA